MIKFTDNSKDRPTLVPGSYTATLYRIDSHPTEEETTQGIVPPFGPYLTFIFKVKEPAEFANAFWSGICGAKRHPMSKLVKWLQGFGGEPDQYFTDGQLDESLLVGKEIQLVLAINPKNQKLQIASISPVGAPVTTTTNSTAGQPIALKPAVRPVQVTKPVAVQKVVPTSLPDDEVPF